MTSLYDLAPRSADGAPYPLAQHRGKVLLIVNTASKCGFTPQYEGLEALWRRHRADGLVVLGFPCNQFGAQEPGDSEEISRFCSLTYDVSFPLMAKVAVNGPETDPVFGYLKSEKKGLLGTAGIKWNFTKFLVGRDGRVIGRYPPQTKPADLEGEIAKALAEPGP
ncbi:MAG: glutathione peroxidase [Methylobacterium sp.]|uniref:glutathione peroxidase n=1 Tax=Methylobacterium sp. TaxID=409 RepID=UPI0025D65BF9|nr:glutathione peroxidase [Methylobacterium sp.]MBX9931667.1 glutathione peroxidase [Methylobacterium sp.]